MNTVVWVLQVLLALAMLGSGIAKSFFSKPKILESGQTGVTHLGIPTIRFIGIIELIGVVGIVLPWLSNVAAWLTPLAALGFAIIMVLAYQTHTRLMLEAIDPARAKKEAGNRITNVVLFIASVIVVVARGAQLLSS
jgi:DoxX-like family